MLEITRVDPPAHDGTAISEAVVARILLVRGKRVLLDESLAGLYGVKLGALVQSVNRNLERFPPDFLFRLSEREVRRLRSRSMLVREWGGRSARPYAFTEQGVAMLSSVLRSPRAVRVNIEIMRAFVRLGRTLLEHEDLARRLADLESRYDGQFRAVFDAIRELMENRPSPDRRIGFHAQGAAPRGAAPGTR